MRENFDDFIRRKLRQFLEQKGWSVSRFAMRYREAYAEMYSKMEAPSTSTARKLVEDKSHRLTENESLVLDSFTQLNFHHLWLEEQKRLLISKTDGYLLDDSRPVVVDSETMLANKIRILEKVPESITPDDVAAIARRYQLIGCKKPLVIYSNLLSLFDCVIETLGPGARAITPDDIGHYFLSTARLYYTVISTDYPDESLEYIAEGVSMTQYPSFHKKLILFVYTNNTNLIEEARVCMGEDLISFTVFGNPGLNSWIEKTPIEKSLQPVNEERLRKCLDAPYRFPKLFKRQIIKCIESPWVRFPSFSNTRDCMNFLNRIEREQNEVYSRDSSLQKSMEELIGYGFPATWFTAECNQIALLEAIRAKQEWSEDHPDFPANEEAWKLFLEIEYSSLLTFGRVPRTNTSDWQGWVFNNYQLCLLEPDNDRLTDVNIAKKRRKLAMQE